MSPKPLILLVDDERSIRTFLRICLSTQDYRTVEAENGVQALALASSYVPDLVVLDLGLPDVDGVEVLRRVRDWSGVPIIVLSARDQERDKVEALDAGADDYLTKPFGVEELLARVRVSLRHAAGRLSGETATVYRQGELTVDLGKREVRRGDATVHLTPIEYKLLSVLARHAGSVVTHKHLLAEVWGPKSAEHQQYLRVYMAGLRRKIEPSPSNPRLLLTEVGVGYRLVESEEAHPGEA